MDASACLPVQKGYLDIVEHLVSLGAEVNKVKNDGRHSSSHGSSEWSAGHCEVSH